MKRQISIRAGLATLVVAAVAACGAGVAHSDGARTVKPIAKPTKAEIAGLFDQWNAALRTGDPERVAARYAPDAVLLPTASPKIRTTHAEIVDYFEHFLQNKPSGKKVRTVINILDWNSAIDAGLYQFTLDRNGEKQIVEARYTYEYEKRGGKWLIVNHHSSVLPPAS